MWSPRPHGVISPRGRHLFLSRKGDEALVAASGLGGNRGWILGDGGCPRCGGDCGGGVRVGLDQPTPAPVPAPPARGSGPQSALRSGRRCFTPRRPGAVARSPGRRLAERHRADVSPGGWPAEIARLAERLSDMADARRGDAAVIRQRELAATARRDAALLEAVAGELELLATRGQPAPAYPGCDADRVCVHGQNWGGQCPHCDGHNRRASTCETRE